MTDCVVRSRIDPDTKAEATEVFAHMGLTLSEAIRLFLYQSIAEQRIPFSINLPNAKTHAVIEEAEKSKNIHKTSLHKLAAAWDK